jgi:hypothetical protein
MPAKNALAYFQHLIISRMKVSQAGWAVELPTVLKTFFSSSPTLQTNKQECLPCQAEFNICG